MNLSSDGGECFLPLRGVSSAHADAIAATVHASYGYEPSAPATLTITGSSTGLGNLLVNMVRQGELNIRRPDDPGQLCRVR